MSNTDETTPDPVAAFSVPQRVARPTLGGPAKSPIDRQSDATLAAPFQPGGKLVKIVQETKAKKKAAMQPRTSSKPVSKGPRKTTMGQLLRDLKSGGTAGAPGSMFEDDDDTFQYLSEAAKPQDTTPMTPAQRASAAIRAMQG